jgi:hypothetical protein
MLCYAASRVWRQVAPLSTRDELRALPQRHSSHGDMQKVLRRQRRIQKHASDKLMNVSFGGVKVPPTL